VPADLLVSHGDVVRVGECTLEVIHLRGHTTWFEAFRSYVSEHDPSIVI
jgi:hypothetical protein